MTKFLLTYHSNTTAQEHMATSPEEMAKTMAPWMAWKEELGDRLVDFGMPLGKTMKVTKGGSSDASSDVVGFSIIQAENMEDALNLVKNHPHLSSGEGAVEVHEFLPMPGM